MCAVLPSVLAVGYENDDPTGDAPAGYYYEPTTETWYYYNGVAIASSGSGPPQSHGANFLVTVVHPGSNMGYELRIEAYFVGEQTVHYRIESAFEDAFGAPFCPSGSHTSTHPCVVTSSVTSTALNGPAGIVLTAVRRQSGLIAQAPNSGSAEAWGWLNDNPHEKEAADYYAGPTTW